MNPARTAPSCRRVSAGRRAPLGVAPLTSARALRAGAFAAALLVTGLAHAAGGAGPEQETIFHGDWDDPGVWELGIVPTDAFDGSIAHVRHIVFVRSPAGVSLLELGIDGATGRLDVSTGADLEAGQIVVGSSGAGALQQFDGTASATTLVVGGQDDALVEFRGGSFTAGSLDIAGLPGQASVEIFEADPVLTVTGDLTVAAGNTLRFSTQAAGPAGLTPVQVGGAVFDPGSTLRMDANFLGQAGDGWDLIVSQTPIVGLPTLVQGGVPLMDLAMDTSDPHVLRVVVAEAAFPVWTDLGGGSPGVNGVPVLTGQEVPLLESLPVSMDLASAPASGFVLVIGSLTSTPLPALGGTVHAHPWTIQMLMATDAAGGLSLGTTWPAGIPADLDLYVQMICQDTSVPDDLTLSNAITARTW